MTVAGLAVLAALLGVLAVLARQRREPAFVWVVSLAGFLILFVGAWSLPLGQRASIGGETLQSTGYLRLLLMLLAAAGGTLTFVGAAVRGSRSIPAPILLWFATTTVALALPSPVPALLLLTTGSLAAVLLAVDSGGAERALVAARGVRAIVVGGFLAVLGIGWAAIATSGLATGPAAGVPDGGPVGLAFLVASAGIVVRAGAIPVHVWASRLAERLPLLAVPVTFAWGPAAFAVVLLAWLGPGVIATGQPVTFERALVAAVAIASVMFGALAAYLHDDLERIVGYSLVSDIGFVLLAFAAPTPDAWGPARLWILAYLVAKSALAGWAATLIATFETNRLPDLAGWARRSPVLAAALVVIGVTTVGLPGLAAFEARSSLIGQALDWPFDLIAWAGVLATTGYLIRLLVIGLARPSAAVALAERVWPELPVDWPGGDWREAVRRVPEAWRLNRILVAATAVLALSLLGLLAAGGGLHAPGAAAAPPPGPGQGEETEPTPSPTIMPTGSAEPEPSPSISTAPAEPPTPAAPSQPGSASPGPSGQVPASASP